MIIRKNQMDQLGDYMRQSFEDRMVTHINRFFPDKAEALGEENLRKQIRLGMEKADRYHVRREKDVAKFVQLKFALHPEFDEQPEMAWTKEILKDHSLPGGEKMDKIYEELPDRLRESAKNADKNPKPGKRG